MPRAKRKRHKLANFERVTLQAIIEIGFCRRWEISAVAGYHDRSIEWARCNLKRFGLIEKRAGLIVATDAGKLLIALLIGQETKRRFRERHARITAATEHESSLSRP
jgi:hypothetical protein